MIPKTIHYCWFGGNPKPKSMLHCIQSWKKFCPDYEIVEWNESNFDVAMNDYVGEAYRAGKWAFVSDYARLWIIYSYGGIYLDTDVEIVKPLDDLLSNEAFFGFEDDSSIATGLGFGAERGNPVVGCMLRDYEGTHFLLPDGSYDKTTCPIRNTNSIVHLLPNNRKANEVTVLKNATLYPPEYFCPLSSDGKKKRMTDNTYSIHWYDASWLSENEKIVHDFRVFKGKCERMFGRKCGSFLARAVYLLRPRERKILKKCD